MEPTGQSATILAAKKMQPHQVALWLAVAFIVASFLVPQLIGGLVLGEQFWVYVSYLFWPVMFLSQQVGGGLSIFVMIIGGGLTAYLVFYIPVKLWMTTSRHLHIALVGCVALGFGTFIVYQNYSAPTPDWTSRGLNPNRLEFVPQVIILSGEYGHTGDVLFEIRMRSQDYYYARRWHGYYWRPGAWYHTDICCHGEGWSFGLHCSSIGTGGGGGGLGCTDEVILPGRRLWKKQLFVGVDTNELVATEKSWPHRREEFSDLIQVGRWYIPQHIHLTDDNGKNEDYCIRKIEFLPTPDTNWFEQVLKSEGRPNKALNEPGNAPGKRRQ